MSNPLQSPTLQGGLGTLVCNEQSENLSAAEKVVNSKIKEEIVNEESLNCKIWSLKSLTKK